MFVFFCGLSAYLLLEAMEQLSEFSSYQARKQCNFAFYLLD